LEEVSIACANHILAEASDGVFEVKINAEAGWGYSATLVTDLLGCP